jgi:hypothetical protein
LSQEEVHLGGLCHTPSGTTTTTTPTH